MKMMGEWYWLAVRIDRLWIGGEECLGMMHCMVSM